MTHHLAHLNVAKLRAPIDDPMIKEFKDGIESINKLAEKSPGFIWRMKEDPIMPDGSSYVIMNDPSLIATLSVWESVEALKNFTYQSAHGSYFKRRNEWFHKMVEANYVLWYVKKDHQPSLAEAISRLKFLRNRGESSKSFTFKTAEHWMDMPS
jgi:heme-degrading monooxygenase HmoA